MFFSGFMILALSLPMARAAEVDAELLRLEDARVALIRNPSAFAPHLLLGEAAWRNSNLPAARFHLEHGLRTAPPGADSIRAAYLHARVLLASNLPLRATRALEMLARRADPPAEALHDLSLLLRQDDRPWEALLMELRALEARPDSLQFLREAAQQWKERGRPDLAFEFWDRISARPDAAGEDHFQLGLSAHRSGRRARAESAYRAALERTPDNPEAHYNLALLLSGGERWPDAVDHFQRVLRLRPSYEPTYFELSWLFLDHERSYDAEEVMLRFLDAGSDSANLVEARSMLDFIWMERAETDSLARDY